MTLLRQYILHDTRQIMTCEPIDIIWHYLILFIFTLKLVI